MNISDWESKGKEYVDKYIKKDVAIEKYSREILCKVEKSTEDVSKGRLILKDYFKDYK